MANTVRRRRATVRCGSTSFTGIAHGCGAGTTGQQAIAAAIAEAKIFAQAAADAWISQQVCPLRCPSKTGKVYSPPRRQARRGKAHKVLENQKFLAPATRANGNGSTELVRVCVAIAWEAVVECKIGSEHEK